MVDLATRARTNIKAFALLVERPLTRRQAEAVALNTKHRFIVILAPRQGGKSDALALRAVMWAFTHPGETVLMVSASDESAKVTLDKARNIVKDAPMLNEALTEDFSALLRLSNGSQIRSVPQSERQIRGKTADLLIIDEAALVERDVFIAAFGTVAARSRHAKIILASTANRTDGMFYDLVQQAGVRDDVVLHHWTTDDCPWITPSFLESQRAVMSPTKYAAEYEGHFASGADALFSREMIERVTRDYASSPLASLVGPARVGAGIDWGATNDRSTFVGVARLPQAGDRVFGVVCAQRWDAGASLEEVVIPQIVASPAHVQRLSVETNGLGWMPTEVLFRRWRERADAAGGGLESSHEAIHPRDLDRLWRQLGGAGVQHNGRTYPDRHLVPKPFPGQDAPPQAFETRLRAIHTTTEVKATAYSAMRLLVDRGALLLPRDATELRRELLLLRVELAQGGTEKVEAAIGHDDLADALAFALGPYRREGDKRWRTWLADLADPSMPVPTPAQHVPLGLPRRPVLQSLAGPQLTIPPGVDLSKPNEPTAAAEAVLAYRETQRKD